ncbi:hypothetical protein B0I35DRAFT_491703 [Stachybotrys elegans]|uniref:Uncharacterized protein n=1 Tax=Stachybotrys elegans TaxID=80388 RepID=A0A8K0SIG5_9HYPO|nr:hypothetical protein B0I35DRAFT_491703 [Stachybotrys elegans]
MAPTSDGQCHWMAILAPRSVARCKPAGYLSAVGWAPFPERLWQGTLLFRAVFLFAFVLNTLFLCAVSKFEATDSANLGLRCATPVLLMVLDLMPTWSASSTSVRKMVGRRRKACHSWSVGLMGKLVALVSNGVAFHVHLHSPICLLASVVLILSKIAGRGPPRVSHSWSSGFAMVLAMAFCMGEFGEATGLRACWGFPSCKSSTRRLQP